jgi:hypothetical protein
MMMLYDPKWAVKTKADPFKLATLIAWLEKQDARQTYCFTSNGECLLAQYFSAHGFVCVHMFTDGFVHGTPIPSRWGMTEARARGLLTSIPPKFNEIAEYGPRTFGAALRRACKVAATAEGPVD